MRDTLDIVQLRTFVAIDDWGGFGRAAAALRMSQPTVSQHVRMLERTVQHPLVQRDGRHARFTSAGERLLDEARRILAVHDEALGRLEVASAEPVVIGCSESAAEHMLPRLLSAVRIAFPERPARFTIDRSTRVTDAVANGTVDLAVVLDLEKASSGTEIGRIPLAWWAAPGWSAAADGAPVPLVVRAEPCGLRLLAVRKLKASGLDVRIAAESSSSEGVIAAARAGLGVALIPSATSDVAGLEVRHDFPELAPGSLRLLARRGLDENIQDVVRNTTTQDGTSRNRP